MKPVPKSRFTTASIPAKSLRITAPGEGLPWEPINPDFPEETIALYIEEMGGYIQPVPSGSVRVEYEGIMGTRSEERHPCDWEFKEYAAIFPTAWGFWGDIFTFAPENHTVTKDAHSARMRTVSHVMETSRQRTARKSKKVKTTVWTTKDGTEIPIREMTDSHLYNTIKFLQRTAEKKVQAFALAPNPFTAEMASDSFDRAQDAVLDNPEEAVEDALNEVPQYDNLLKEATRRGLNIR